MTVRQMGKRLDQISLDHVLRYDFASRQLQGRILDAACGVGYGSKMLQDLGNMVTGLDISPDAIHHAHAYFPGPEYVVADIAGYSPDGEFDGIVSLETIEHLPNPLPVLRMFRFVCRGLLIASVPNEKYFPFRAEDFDHEYPHQRHYLDHEFEDLLEEADFEVMSKHCQKSKKEPEVIDGVEGRFLVFVCR